MKKYLIIGGKGFIGSHLSKALFDQGNKVVVIDNAVGGPGKIHNPNITSYNIPVENTEKFNGVFEKEKPDVVFHLAGAINLRRAPDDPLFLNDRDFLSRTQSILDACKTYKVKKILFISSGGAIYQDATKVPTSEKYLPHPKSLYGLANLMIEKYIEMYCGANNIDFTFPRLSNVYGPEQWQSGIVPSLIEKMLKGESPVIYGTGNQTRDFIYITDVVQALITLAQEGKNEIYNVGSGREVSLKEVFMLTKSLLGINIKPTYQKARSQETQRSALDIKKIKKEFDWVPTTNINDGLSKTIEYYQNAKV